MFQLTEKEEEFLRSQFATSNPVRGGRRFLPYVFTEHGAVMLASVLNSLDTLEKKYDSQFRTVFDAIRQLMTPPEPKASDKDGKLISTLSCKMYVTGKCDDLGRGGLKTDQQS